MKKTVSIILLIAAAALMLCACGAKSGGSHACAGSWECLEIPSDMKAKTVTLELTDTSFTYSLGGDTTTIVIEGEAKTTGDKSMVLYMQNKKEVNNADRKVLRERKAEASTTDADPVYAQLNADGTLSLSAVQTQLTLVRVK